MDLIVSEVEFKNSLSEYVWVFVDFYAMWCGPCKRIAPILSKLKKQFPDVYFCKVDVDQSETLTQKYKIRSMPTFLLFRDGNLVDTVSGADSAEVLKMLNKTKIN